MAAKAKYSTEPVELHAEIKEILESWHAKERRDTDPGLFYKLAVIKPTVQHVRYFSWWSKHHYIFVGKQGGFKLLGRRAQDITRELGNP